MGQHLGMELLPDERVDHLEQQHEARDLDAARGRARAAADEHEQDDQELGEGGPDIEVIRDEAGRRGDRGDLEGRVAEGLCAREVHAVHEVPGDERGGCREHHKVGLELAVFPEHPGALFPDGEVETEVAAAEHHEKGHPGFERGVVEMGDARVVGGEAAGGRGGKGVVNGGERIDAAGHEGNPGGQGEDHVDDEKRESRGLDAWQHPVGGRAGGLRIEHVHRSAAHLRQQRDKDHDDTETAEPMRHAAPEQYAARQGLDAVDDRGACARKAGDALKDALEHRQVAADGVGQHAQRGDHDPAQSRDRDALPHGELRADEAAGGHEQDTEHCAGDDGAGKSQAARLRQCQCEQKREEECHTGGQREPAQNIRNDL